MRVFAIISYPFPTHLVSPILLFKLAGLPEFRLNEVFLLNGCVHVDEFMVLSMSMREVSVQIARICSLEWVSLLQYESRTFFLRFIINTECTLL